MTVSPFRRPSRGPQSVFSGRPSFGKANPCLSAAFRRMPARFIAALRSGPGGVARASLVSLVLCQRLVDQFALRTFKRAQFGTSKAGLDTDQHHANLALGAARPLDHAKGMRFGHVCTPFASGGSATLSVTDNS